MARTRAERRHQLRRIKAKRRNYVEASSGSLAHVGKAARTAPSCSCWLCGHQRYHHGPNIQELARTRRCTRKKGIMYYFKRGHF